MYDKGYATVCNDKKGLKKALESKEDSLSLAVISFPEVLLGIDADLSTIIERWIDMDVQEGYRKAVADRELNLCKEMEAYTDDKKFIYNFITIPYNEEDVTLHGIWKRMYRHELEGTEFPIENSIPDVSGELEELEQSYRICDLLYTYSDRFGHSEHIEEIQKRKMELAEKIASELAKKKLKDRKCKYCGKILSWNYPYGMCNECHDQMYPSRRNNWYDDNFDDWY